MEPRAGDPPRFGGGQSQSDLDELTQADIDDAEQPPRGMGNLMSKDLTLGNLDAGAVEAHRFLVKNQQEFAEAEHPPQGSMVRGVVRAALLGDPADRKQPLDPSSRTDEYSERLIHEARISRSKNGFQQEKMVEQRQVHRTEDARFEDQNDSSGGFLGLFS